MSRRAPRGERSGRRLSARTRVLLVGCLVVLAIASATWFGAAGTGRVSTDVDRVATRAERLGMLRTAERHLEAAHASFSAGVAVGGPAALTQGISDALSSFDAGVRAWEDFQQSVPAADEAEQRRRDALTEGIAALRSAGEQVAGQVVTEPEAA